MRDDGISLANFSPSARIALISAFSAEFTVTSELAEGSVSYLGQEVAPIGFEPGSCFRKSGHCSTAMLARMQSRIKAARPLPLIDVDRNVALTNRAHAQCHVSSRGLSLRVRMVTPR
jgi:hypothetical protein